MSASTADDCGAPYAHIRMALALPTVANRERGALRHAAALKRPAWTASGIIASLERTYGVCIETHKGEDT